MRFTTGLAAALVAAAIGVGFAGAATESRTITFKHRFKWGTSMRSCVAPRANSEICVAIRGKVKGLGAIEYARDAAPAGLPNTPDGCPRYSTVGTLWVKGGKIRFHGKPAETCGSDPQQPGVSPDANYIIERFTKGTGVLAGATGKITVLAARGTDIWEGTLTLKR